MSHLDLDRASLEMAEEIASRLRANPDLLSVARENLDRWTKRNADSPSLLAAYEEWRRLLELPLEEVCAILTAETDEGQRLRQNSPFPGVLSEKEVWAIKAKYWKSGLTIEALQARLREFEQGWMDPTRPA